MTEAPVLPGVDTSSRAPLWKSIARLPGAYIEGAFYVCSDKTKPSHKTMCLGRIHGVECTCSTWTYLEHEGAQAIEHTGAHKSYKRAERSMLGSHWLECWYIDHPEEKRVPFDEWWDALPEDEQPQILAFQAGRR